MRTLCGGGNVGLLHDVDYDRYPKEHCKKCVEILKQEDVPEEMIHSIQSHGYGICSDIKPEKYMEKVLYTIDELTGLITAAALMQPDKLLSEVKLASLKKKFKSKGFAAGVNRDLITKGAEELGLELDYIMEQTLIAMQEAHESLGL